MPESDSNERTVDFTFFTEKAGSTVIEQIPGRNVEDAVACWRTSSEIRPAEASESDEATPVSGVKNVWCISGFDSEDVFYLTHVVATEDDVEGHMKKEEPSGDQQIAAFGNSLSKMLGTDDFPPGALGDLSDLLDTLRRGVTMLTGLMELRRDFERAPAKKLHELEILVADDIPMIINDLVPSLTKMRERAYSMRYR